MSHTITDQIYVVGATKLAQECEKNLTVVEFVTVLDLLAQLTQLFEINDLLNTLEQQGKDFDDFELWATNKCIDAFVSSNPSIHEASSEMSDKRYFFQVLGFCIVCLRDRANENFEENFEVLSIANGLIMLLNTIQDNWREI